MTPDTSGPEWQTPFVFYDPLESCWRTSQATFLSGSDLFSGTWPRSGMTRGGFAYELPMPALPTVEPVCSSLPTPRATRGGSATETVYLLASEGASRGPLLPTPTAMDSAGSRGHKPDGTPYGPTSGTTPTDAVLLPTPGCAGGDKKIPEDAVWSGKAAYKPDGTKVQVHIDQIARLLATPNARDYKGSPSAAREGQASLPRDVERLSRGEPTSPPSDDGSASSDVQLPGQLSLDELLSG